MVLSGRFQDSSQGFQREPTSNAWREVVRAMFTSTSLPICRIADHEPFLARPNCHSAILPSTRDYTCPASGGRNTVDAESFRSGMTLRVSNPKRSLSPIAPKQLGHLVVSARCEARWAASPVCKWRIRLTCRGDQGIKGLHPQFTEAHLKNFTLQSREHDLPTRSFLSCRSSQIPWPKISVMGPPA